MTRQQRKTKRITSPETVAAILERLHAGQYIRQVSKALDVSPAVVTTVARKAGVVPVRCPRFGPAVQVIPKPMPASLEQEWYAKKCHARWFGGMGA